MQNPPLDKIVFERTRTDGKHLVCHIKDGVFGFTLDGVKVQRRTRIDFLTIHEMVERSYIDDALFNDMLSKGVHGFWNNQIAMTSNEYQLAVCAQKESKQYLAEKAAYDAKNQISVFLSTRGWGDFSDLVWTGDKNLPDDVILAQCKQLFETSFDVDRSFDEKQVLDAVRKAKNGSKTELTEDEQKRLAEARTLVDNAPQRIVDLFLKYGGEPNNLPDDIDHPDYWALKNYADAMWLIANTECN